MVRRDVVRDVVEHEPQAAAGELLPGGLEAGRAAEAPVDRVAAHGVGRPDDVGVGHVRQRRAHPVHPLVAGDRGGGGAALPYAHQPDRVDARRQDGVPDGRGHVGERDRPPEVAGDVGQPWPGGDLEDDGVPGPRGHG
jgi:hypothetical protein